MPWKGWRNSSWGKDPSLPPFFSTYPCFVCVPGQTGSSSCGTHCWAWGQLQAEQAGKRGRRGAYRPTPAGPQHGSTSTQGMEFRVCAFLSSTPSAPDRSTTAAAKERSPRVRLVKKQAFILHVLLTVTAWRHCSCQSYYETNQVPDSGLALPHPQESQHCTKLYLQGKQSETVSPKTPCNSEENVQDKCDSYALHTARLPTGCSQDWWKPRASRHRLLKGAWQS